MSKIGRVHRQARSGLMGDRVKPHEMCAPITIVEKVFAPQCGNWIHLKYSSRLKCDKAINYNERIIGTGFMIGVVYCKDESIVDKENLEKNSSLPVNRVRPLAHVAYNNVMESIFGW